LTAKDWAGKTIIFRMRKYRIMSMTCEEYKIGYQFINFTCTKTTPPPGTTPPLKPPGLVGR
jgi:hypothetical protein